MSTRNILVVGDRGCGKTAWLNRLAGGIWAPEYTPTVAASESISLKERLTTGERRKLVFHTLNDQNVVEHMAIQATIDGVIILIDATLSQRALRASHAKWYRFVNMVYPGVPLTVWLTKGDLDFKTKFLGPDHPDTRLRWFSSRTCLDLYHPIEALLPELFGEGIFALLSTPRAS